MTVIVDWIKTELYEVGNLKIGTAKYENHGNDWLGKIKIKNIKLVYGFLLNAGRWTDRNHYSSFKNLKYIKTSALPQNVGVES